MATLTQCLATALVRMVPKDAHAPVGHGAPVRVVLSVLAGAPLRGGVPAPLRYGTGAGRGVAAALVASLLRGPPMGPAHGGGGPGGMGAYAAPPALAPQGVGEAGGSGAAPPPVRRRGQAFAAWLAGSRGAPRSAAPPRTGQGTGLPAPRGPQSTARPLPRPQSLHAGPEWPEHNGADLTGTEPSGPVAAEVGPGGYVPGFAGGARTHGVGAARRRLTGQHVVAMWLGRAGTTPSREPGRAGRMGARAPYAPVSYVPVAALPGPAGFMAGVVHPARKAGTRAGAVLPGAPSYLLATSRAVEVASTVPPQYGAPAPTVQAQVTVNTTSTTPQAIGDEIAHRMDTLRMQARQANMGQF